MSQLSTPRIGPAMITAAWFADSHPGCTQQQASLAVGPNGSNYYGSRTVQRAMGAGLIDGGWDGRRYHLTITDKGRQAVRRAWGL